MKYQQTKLRARSHSAIWQINRIRSWNCTSQKEEFRAIRTALIRSVGGLRRPRRGCGGLPLRTEFELEQLGGGSSPPPALALGQKPGKVGPTPTPYTTDPHPESECLLRGGEDQRIRKQKNSAQQTFDFDREWGGVMFFRTTSSQLPESIPD